MVKNPPQLSSEKRADRVRFRVEESMLILLLIITIVGVILMDYSAEDGYWYWLAMFFVFWLAAIVTGFVQTREKQHWLMELLRDQFFHWLGTFIVICSVFSLMQINLINPEVGAPVILLILALATYIDGIRLGWRFGMAGLHLLITALLISHIDDFLPYTILAAICIIVITAYTGKRDY